MTVSGQGYLNMSHGAQGSHGDVFCHNKANGDETVLVDSAGIGSQAINV